MKFGKEETDVNATISIDDGSDQTQASGRGSFGHVAARLAGANRASSAIQPPTT